MLVVSDYPTKGADTMSNEIPESYREAVRMILRSYDDCHEYDCERESTLWMIDRLSDYDLNPSVSAPWFDSLMQFADRVAESRLC